MSQGQTDAGGERLVWIVGVAVLLLGLGVVGWVVVGVGGSETARRSTSVSPAVTGPAPTSDAPGDGANSEACAGVAAATTALPTAAPDDLTYEVDNRAVIPVSDSYGPANRTGPVWTCFSRSPMGAVLAAKAISTRSIASLDRIQVAEEQLVDNEGRKILLDRLRTPHGNVLAEQEAFIQPAGFRVESYDHDTAVVALVSEAQGGRCFVAILTVVWEDGTWKLRLLPNGSASAASTPVANLDRYITWDV